VWRTGIAYCLNSLGMARSWPLSDDRLAVPKRESG
jgi:hypothetical protein